MEQDPVKRACGAMLDVLENDAPMNELRHELAAGGFAGTPESVARFVSMVVARGWARLSTSTWPGEADPGATVDVAASRGRIVDEASRDPRPADALVLTATDALEGVMWRHFRRRPAHSAPR